MAGRRMKYGKQFKSSAMGNAAEYSKWFMDNKYPPFSDAEEFLTFKKIREKTRNRNRGLVKWADEHPEEFRRHQILFGARSSAMNRAKFGKCKITLPKLKCLEPEKE